MAEELRQGINNVTLYGEVKEHKLKYNKDKDGDYINGSLVINTGEYSEIEIKVFVGEKTAKGKVKKSFETLNKFINEDVLTLASCKSEEDKQYVAKVKIFGSKEFTPCFKENIFKIDDSGEVKTKRNIELGFGNITIDNNLKPEDYKAEYDIEMFVTSVKEEEKQGEQTGRAIIVGWTPVYGGKVIPMEIIATEEDAEGILSDIEEGSTINVWGQINYKSIITKTQKGGGIGKAKIEEHREYVNELLFVGGDIQEDEEKEFDMELIKKAKTERDLEIDEKKNEESKGDGKKKGSGLNKTKTDSDKPKRERPKF